MGYINRQISARKNGSMQIGYLMRWGHWAEEVGALKEKSGRREICRKKWEIGRFRPPSGVTFIYAVVNIICEILRRIVFV